MNRRQFLTDTGRSALAAAGAGAFLSLMGATGGRRPPAIAPDWDRRGLLRPPGARPEEELLARCIRCLRCSQVCETDAIRLFGEGTGTYAGTPYLVPETHACDLCLECGRTCPTGALVPLNRPAEARMGIAVVDPALCVSHNGTGICGACYTVCPLRGRAITQGFRNRPSVIPDRCTGCGLCEEACIVDRDKAIRVFSDRRWLA